MLRHGQWHKINLAPLCPRVINKHVFGEKMSPKKNNMLISIIALCCVCFFTLSCTNKEADFKSAMASYNKKDFSSALLAFQSLATQNYDKAEFMLGKMYAFGEGVPEDYNQAIQWFTKAAEQGNADAQFCLGVQYGWVSVVKDAKQAAQWFSKAAEQGDVYAQTGWPGCIEEAKTSPRIIIKPCSGIRKLLSRATASSK